MYLIKIGITRIKSETDIIKQIREGDKLPLIQEYDSKRWIYVNAEQISTITVLDDNGELPPNQIVKGLIVAHDAMVDILQAEAGEGPHILTLSEYSEIEATARWFRELHDKYGSIQEADE